MISQFFEVYYLFKCVTHSRIPTFSFALCYSTFIYYPTFSSIYKLFFFLHILYRNIFVIYNAYKFTDGPEKLLSQIDFHPLFCCVHFNQRFKFFVRIPARPDDLYVAEVFEKNLIPSVKHITYS